MYFSYSLHIFLLNLSELFCFVKNYTYSVFSLNYLIKSISLVLGIHKGDITNSVVQCHTCTVFDCTTRGPEFESRVGPSLVIRINIRSWVFGSASPPCLGEHIMLSFLRLISYRSCQIFVHSKFESNRNRVTLVSARVLVHFNISCATGQSQRYWPPQPISLQSSLYFFHS